jgi:quercetin dioxygenase-like cupin family protein
MRRTALSRSTIRRAIRGPVFAIALGIALVTAFTGSVLATPSTGFHSVLTSRGTLTTNVQFNTGEIKFQTKADVDFVSATLDIDPNASSGWHSHPGVVLVTVAAGSLTFYDASCVATVHTAGSSFVESGDVPGLVRNESATVPARVFATYIVPAGTPNTSLRVDLPNPGCPQS